MSASAPPVPGRYEDQNWPRASDWLNGKFHSKADGQSLLAVLGAPLNSSITPGRSDLAPGAIRRILERFSILDLPHNNDLRMIRVEDGGDLDVLGKRPEEAVGPIAERISKFRDRRCPVVLLGGDNSITRPGVMGLKAPLGRCGLLTLDAHFDIRELEHGLNNGNPVRALLRDGLLGRHIVQIGIQSYSNSPEYAQLARDAGITYVPVEQVWDDGIDRTMKMAFDTLRDVDALYVDLDIDVLDRSFAPAAPGSRPGGLMPWQLRQIAYLCGSHYNVAVMDIVEIDPEKDVADATVMCAAACLLSFASGTLERREHK